MAALVVCVWYLQVRAELTSRTEHITELQQERLRSERMEQIDRDGHISVKITPSQELSDYILGELKNIK